MSELISLFGRKRDTNPNHAITCQGQDYLLFQESLKTNTYVLANPIFFVETVAQLDKVIKFSYVDNFGKSISKKIIPSKWSKSSNFNTKILTLEGLQVIVNEKTKLELELIDDEITIVWELHKKPTTKEFLGQDLSYLFTEGNPRRSSTHLENITFTISKTGIPITVHLSGIGQVQLKDSDTNTVLGTFNTQGTHTVNVEENTNVNAVYSVDPAIDSPSDAKSSQYFFQRVGAVSINGTITSPSVNTTVPNATGHAQVATSYKNELLTVTEAQNIDVVFEKSSAQNFLGHYKAQQNTNHIGQQVDYDVTAENLILDTNTFTTVARINDLTGKGNHLEQFVTGKNTQSAFNGVKINFDGTDHQGYEYKGSRVNYSTSDNTRLFSFLVCKINTGNAANTVFVDIAGNEAGNNGGNVVFADGNNVKVGFDAPAYGGGVIRTGASTALSLIALFPDPDTLGSHIADSSGYTNDTDGSMSSSLSQRYGYFKPTLGNIGNDNYGLRGLRPLAGDLYELLIITNLHTADEVEYLLNELKTAYTI